LYNHPFSWEKTEKRIQYGDLKKHNGESHQVFPLESEIDMADYINTKIKNLALDLCM